MIEAIYIEDEIAEHPRTLEICSRFPKAVKIACRRYGEVFNRKAQNFRLQKMRPSLILAKKFERHVLETPEGYGIGGERNYYFSHMLNCLYDCRYCFLQGMYRSGHYVVFVNYEDFFARIEALTRKAPEEDSYFFSGYDCDSLAFETVTGFVREALPVFRCLPQAWLELRTKSTQIGCLLETDPIKNCVVAFSFTPGEISEALEHKVPTVERRLAAMRQLADHGYALGLRFDPLIYTDDFQAQYETLFSQVFAAIDRGAIHSVSFGPFRLPSGFFRAAERLYPEEPLWSGPLERRQGMVSYREDLENEMIDFCTRKLRDFVPESAFFPCRPGSHDSPPSHGAAKD